MTRNIKNVVDQVFGETLRVRVSGILIEGKEILMIKHRGLSIDGIFWAPPGGGMHFGETARNCLKREFREEAGIVVSVGEFLCVTEFLEAPLHAIELFFLVTRLGGEVKQGSDPELKSYNQIIEKVTFLSFNRLEKIPHEQLHTILHGVSSSFDIVQRHGYTYISANVGK